MTNNNITTIRWSRNNNISALNQIDRICGEYNCSRASAIKMICDRLLLVDTSLLNPLNLPPKILTD
jgi:hypothetical protein